MAAAAIGGNMKIAIFAGALALACTVAPAQACPAPPNASEWRELAEEPAQLSGYALLRWLHCGWRTAEPAFVQARRLYREAVAAETEDAEAYEPDADPFVLLLHVNPEPFVAALREEMEEPDEDAPASFAALQRLPLVTKTAARRYEEGLPEAVALLRREPLAPASVLLLDLALAKQQLRQGNADAARASLERLAADTQANDALGDSRALELLQELRNALALPQPPRWEPADAAWTLQRSARRPLRHCGTATMAEQMFGAEPLREAVLRAADPDVAIDELLSTQWRDYLEGGGDHAALLVELLRKRHGESGLRQGWDDALALLHEGVAPSLQLFGRPLPLPARVIEDAADGGSQERALRRDELVALVQGSAVYQLSFAQTAAAED